MKQFYDRRRHYTVDGRVVYDRKPHKFRVGDAVRILRSLELPTDAKNAEKLLFATKDAFFLLCVARSYENGAKQQGIPPIGYKYDWFDQFFLALFLEYSAAVVASRGDRTKFEGIAGTI